MARTLGMVPDADISITAMVSALFQFRFWDFCSHLLLLPCEELALAASRLDIQPGEVWELRSVTARDSSRTWQIGRARLCWSK